MDFAIIFIGIVLISISTYFIIISIGYRKSNIKLTYGYKKEFEHLRNAYVGMKSGRFYKNWTNVIYTYTVKSKVYEARIGAGFKPNGFPGSVKIVYQKNNPKRSYIKNMNFPYEWVLGGLLFLVTTAYLIVALIVLL